MLYKRILLFLFFTIICVKAFSAVFVVTSNADSGPGTLRDALTQAAANGSAEKDYINFNLPDTSAVGRTILLVTQLPDLSSNLVIDGTTQVGWPFGEGNARIEVSTPKNYNSITTFNGSGLHNVEFYGLYIYDYYDIITSYPDLEPRTAIKILNSSDIIFGAAGKGNVIRGFNYYSLDIEGTDVLQVQGNIIGLGKSNTIGDDGNGYIAAYTGVIYLIGCNHIAFGGDDMAQGNIVFTMMIVSFAQQTNDVMSIKSNNFCVYQNGKSTEWYFEFYNGMIRINTAFSNDVQNTDEASASVDMDISNNIVGSQMGVFEMQFLKGTINCTKNYFNVARDGVTDVTYLGQISSPINPFDVTHCSAQFNIGTNNFSDRNFFHYVYSGFAISSDPNVFLRYNDFKCVSFNPYTNYIPNNAYTLPVVAISAISNSGPNTMVTGTSTPNSTIDIYSSESCQSQCSIRSYLQTVAADNAGKWQAVITNLNGIFYVSATLNNQTSLFETLQINSDHVNIQPMRCSNLATITGLQVPSGVSYYWIDANGNVVSHDLNLTTNKPGKYQLVLGSGCITSDPFEIDDDRLTIYDSGATMTNIACGENNGSIKGLFVYDPESKIQGTTWYDASGKIVGNTPDIANLSAGSYTLKVLTTDGCETDYGPVTLKNTTGPNIDQSNQNITSTPCGQSTGSITNIAVTGTGTLKYVWTDSQQQQVGTAKDLTGQPAGVYKLQVTDDTQCGPIYSTDITIPATNGITMDESGAKITFANCSTANGSITGIQVTGAVKYVWTYAGGTLITTAPYIVSVPAGDYTLTASNGFGCSVTSKTYTIGQNAPTQFPAYTATVVSSCFGANNGSITVATDALVKSARWVDGQGQNAGAATSLTGIGSGTYKLYLTDQNGCEQLYGTYPVTELAAFNVQNTGTPASDECGLKTGSIPAVTVAGGAPPYTYVWTDSDGEQIGSGNSITNLGAGVYKLYVSDTRCGNSTTTYTVDNDEAAINTPSVSNVQLCSAGGALLSVNNADASAVYRLYDSQTAAQPIDEQKGGRFNISVTANKSFFITEVNGTCESNRAEIDVTVGLSALNIANTITPNDDNINDHWDIPGIENYPAATIQIFTRNGQRIFNSTGYSKPFDGTYNGAKLPAGVYYYIINLSTNCNILSGSLTVVR